MLDLNTVSGRNEFSSRIRNARKANGDSQESFAEKLGVKRETVSKWETGKNIPDTKALSVICSVLSVDLGHLLSCYTEKNELTHAFCEKTGLSEDAYTTLLGIPQSKVSVLNAVLTSPHFMKFISNIDESVQFADNRGDLIKTNIMQRLNDERPTVPAKDMDTIFKFCAVDEAGKIFDEVSAHLYDRRNG